MRVRPLEYEPTMSPSCDTVKDCSEPMGEPSWLRADTLFTLAYWLSGLVAVPSSVFYEDPTRGEPLVRFAFCKRTEVLEEAAERLAGLS